MRRRATTALDRLQCDELYGNAHEENYAKNYLNNDNIPEEENEVIKKVSFGGMIVCRGTIGRKFCESYNTAQIEHMRQGSMAHKNLCELRDEPIGLIFLTIHDFLDGIEDYQTWDRKELCFQIQANIQKIITDEMPWAVNYSKYIIKEYYGMPVGKMKIKLNFLMDDGKYGEDAGGLLFNGFLEELSFYATELEFPFADDIGVICQLLGPSGIPSKKKWCQLDVGVSFVGKRLLHESMHTACIRGAATIRAAVHPDVIRMSYVNKPIYFGPQNQIYKGYTIYIWEIWYPDQINFLPETGLNYAFCKCAERTALLNIPR